MGCVDLNLHPSAFMVKDQGLSRSTPSWEGLLCFIVGMICWIGQGLAYTYFVGAGLSMIEQYKPIAWSIVTALKAMVASALLTIQQEWLLILLIILSGTIGFGTVVIMFKSIRITGKPPPKF